MSTNEREQGDHELAVLVPAHELPDEYAHWRRHAVRLELLTIGFLLAAITMLYFVLGSSQAMRTAWYEDILSLIPPIVFLIGGHFRAKEATRAWPYGHHRVPTLMYLAAGLALLAMGGFLLLESSVKLVEARHPTIGTVVLPVLDTQVWLGWLMMGAMALTVPPAVVLGRAKLKVAARIHDPVLHADADMNKADWTTAVATIVGVGGVGLGLWWADSAAAAFISLGIVRDGVNNVRLASTALIDKMPQLLSENKPDPLLGRVRAALEQDSDVKIAMVRMRSYGQVLIGEAFVRPVDRHGPFDEGDLRRLATIAEDVHWRIQQVVVSTWDDSGNPHEDD